MVIQCEFNFNGIAIVMNAMAMAMCSRLIVFNTSGSPPTLRLN